jgi:hypothetical protein
MRKIVMPNEYLPSALRTEVGIPRRSHEGEIPPFQHVSDSPSTNWEEPWLSIGQAEPGWWQAFSIDQGVRSTRTPDKFIRKQQDTNVFDLPTGELMGADRLAELARSKSEDEIHKRIERLRAAMEAPPAKTFGQKERAIQPLSGPAVEPPKVVEARTKADPSDAPGVHGVEIPRPEVVGTGSQPLSETLMTFLPMRTMIFVPSAFQSALYRIDVLLKHPLLMLTDRIGDVQEVPKAPLSATSEKTCGSEAMEVQSWDEGMAALQELDRDLLEAGARSDKGMGKVSGAAEFPGIKVGIAEAMVLEDVTFAR